MDIETQAQFIRQEHRLFHVLRNFLTRNHRFPDLQDPRRQACVSAFLWNLLFSSQTIVVGGGVLGLASLYLLWNQNQLLQENNLLIAKSISPDQQYTISISSDFSIVRLVKEGNKSSVEKSPIGIGSVLLSDIAISCSGNSPLLIEKITIDIRFKQGAEEHSVSFVAFPDDKHRRVVKPDEIELFDLRLVPKIQPTDAIEQWNASELHQGEITILVLGRDLLGDGWGITEVRNFKSLVDNKDPSFAIDPITSYWLSDSDKNPTESLDVAMNLRAGDPQNVIGSVSLAFSIEKKAKELTRIVSRLKKGWENLEFWRKGLRL